MSSVLNLLKLCNYFLAFEFQVVYLTALVRDCLDAYTDIDGISTVFYQKAQGDFYWKSWQFHKMSDCLCGTASFVLILFERIKAKTEGRGPEEATVCFSLRHYFPFTGWDSNTFRVTSQWSSTEDRRLVSDGWIHSFLWGVPSSTWRIANDVLQQRISFSGTCPLLIANP